MDQTDVETKKGKRARRTRSLPGLARKVSELAAQLEQTARIESERDVKDHERVRVLVKLATGDGAEKLMRNCPLYRDDDKEFLREHGWRV